MKIYKLIFKWYWISKLIILYQKIILEEFIIDNLPVKYLISIYFYIIIFISKIFWFLKYLKISIKNLLINNNYSNNFYYLMKFNNFENKR